MERRGQTRLGVVRVPELGGDEELLARDDALVDDLGRGGFKCGCVGVWVSLCVCMNVCTIKQARE